jgi:hypothetical protein
MAQPRKNIWSYSVVDFPKFFDFSQGQKQMQDLYDLSQKAFVGFEQLTGMFEKFYQPDLWNKYTPQYLKACESASARFQQFTEEFLTAMGLVSKEKYMQLKAESQKLNQLLSGKEKLQTKQAKEIASQKKKLVDLNKAIADQIKMVSAQQKEIADHKKMVAARIKEIGAQQKLVADLKKEIAEHKKLLAERTKEMDAQKKMPTARQTKTMAQPVAQK